MSHSKAEASRKRRVFSEEFKQDAVRLVVSEKYSFVAAAKEPEVLVPRGQLTHRRRAHRAGEVQVQVRLGQRPQVPPTAPRLVADTPVRRRVG